MAERLAAIAARLFRVAAADIAILNFSVGFSVKPSKDLIDLRNVHAG